MVGLGEAGALTGRGQSLAVQPMLPGRGDGRGWHWSEAEDGTLLICLDSLMANAVLKNHQGEEK